MIARELSSTLQSRFFQKKAIVLVGARQVGKTTLLRSLADDARATGKKSIFLNCDEPDTRQQLALPDSTKLGALAGDADFVFIDEAQRVQDIGLTLKLLIDAFPEKQVVVSGSSALELSNRINEPLTGRKYDFHLFPLSKKELVAHAGALEENRLLENRLIYGAYPDVASNRGHERELLAELASSYLYKDIFAFQDIRKPAVLETLLRALALQIGSEASLCELAVTCGLNVLTIRRYLDLLEKTFIVFHLPSFSRNARTELRKSMKFYFYDNGIRNALISNFSSLALRTDTGFLWENYLMSERLKRIHYDRSGAKGYFWRTHQQQEIDYVEEKDGVLSAFEFKWNAAQKAKLPATFATHYPDAKFTVVNRENHQDFLLPAGA